MFPQSFQLKYPLETEVDSVTQQANKLQENHVILSHHNVHRLEDATNRWVVGVWVDGCGCYVGVCGMWVCVGVWETEEDSVTQQANRLQENHVILSHHNVHRLEDATNRWVCG